MADIVIMGAGLSGAIMAYEMKGQMRPEDRLTVVTKDPLYHSFRRTLGFRSAGASAKPWRSIWRRPSPNAASVSRRVR